MEKLHEHFYVDRSPVFELFVLIFQLTRFKKEEKESYQKPQTEALNEWLEKQQENLADDLLEEMNVFFHPDSFFGLSLTQLIYQENKHGDIEECLAFLQKQNPKKIISCFFNTGHNYLDDESIIEDPIKIHEHIKSSTLPMDEKSKLFYLYFNPEDTRERLVALIQKCYEKIYKENTKQLEAIHTEGIQKFKSLSIQQLYKIINFEENTPVEKLPKTIIMIPSYYLQDRTTFSYDDDPNTDNVITIVGMDVVTKLLDGANTEEKIIEFARALSDKKRINIIQELNKAPRYGYELAQRLNLSSPTISHHMSILFRLGLVTTSKYENKIYYEVNKEKLKQSFTEMIDLLT